MSYQFINSDVALKEFCTHLQTSNGLALDTEFMRTKTFYPCLALLQVYDGINLALIDPLLIDDWQPFVDILKNNKIEKYFHACSEDIEVFTRHFDCVPENILDSQILASFLDNPLSSGYATLVDKYLSIKLDKSETRTDWLQRPLTDRQCLYAANDVLYLLPLMHKLKSLLFDNGFLNAAYEECLNAVKRRSQSPQADEAYLQIKNAWQLRPIQLGYLKKLASWRFEYARSHDIALNFVIHQDILWSLARYQPKSLSELSALGMNGKQLRLFGDTLLSILKKASEPVAQIKRMTDYPDYKKWSTLIKEAAEEISMKTGLNSELLVSKRHIEQFLRWHNHDMAEQPEILTGWRGKLFKRILIKDE